MGGYGILMNLSTNPNKKTTQKLGGFLLVFPESSPKTVTCLDLRLGCDPARARTEDPKIKSLLLYQLSYGVKNLSCKYTGNLFCRNYLDLIFALPKREHSSAGSEHLPYKQRVRGSNPCAPTQK